ncbi:MAG: hypothetical protein JWR26_941 [Pedosphaera sp.]|nr:hypothetical protein [Pedosphaera sp.]
MRRRLHYWLVVLIAVAIPGTAWGCEPILPLVQLLGGTTAASSLILTRSVFWLLFAVAVKSAAFAFFQQRLPWRKAVVYMLLANVVSTVPGLLIAGLAGAGSGILFALPLVLILAMIVGRRYELLWGPHCRFSAISATFVFFLIFLVSFDLYLRAGVALDEHAPADYWLNKFLFVSLVVVTGIILSAAMEEYVVFRLSRKTSGNASFFAPVLRANYITLALILFVAAMEILPRRLHAKDFITSWLHSLFAVLGLA